MQHWESKDCESLQTYRMSLQKMAAENAAIEKAVNR